MWHEITDRVDILVNGLPRAIQDHESIDLRLIRSNMYLDWPEECRNIRVEAFGQVLPGLGLDSQGWVQN